MGSRRTERTSLESIKAAAGRLRLGVNGGMVDTRALDVYEIRPRKDGDGFDLVSDRFRRGPIWYAGPDAVRNAFAYAKYRSHSRSRRAIIRVLDHSGAVIKTHSFPGASE
jgi:hypothetical protein